MMMLILLTNIESPNPFLLPFSPKRTIGRIYRKARVEALTIYCY